jgi:hypothetical protein
VCTLKKGCIVASYVNVNLTVSCRMTFIASYAFVLEYIRRPERSEPGGQEGFPPGRRLIRKPELSELGGCLVG